MTQCLLFSIIECPPGHYGRNCVNTCGHCEAGICDHINGTCINGCLEGWSGQTCHNSKSYLL